MKERLASGARGTLPTCHVCGPIQDYDPISADWQVSGRINAFRKITKKDAAGEKPGLKKE